MPEIPLDSSPAAKADAERIEENGRIHYKVAGEISDTDKGAGTDIYAVEHGLISVTPVGIDMTDYPLLEKLGKSV